MDPMLLQREKEYREINEKLDARARQLLEKVDIIKEHSNDIQLSTAFSILNNNSNAYKRSKSVADVKFSSEELTALDLTEDVNKIGAKGFVQFLKSKVKQLQSVVDKLKHDYDIKCGEFRKSQKDNVTLHEDRDRFLREANTSRMQVAKLESQLSLARSRLQARDSESAALKKELEDLKRDLKSASILAKSSEAKSQRMLEDLSKAKAALRTTQQDASDMKEVHRKHSASLNHAIRVLEKQKEDLLNAFQRQYVLVENLKCQKAHVAALKVTDKIEADLIEMCASTNT